MENKRILIVDDDPVLLRMLEKILKRDGYHVTKANNGKIGLEKAEKEDPFLIVLDILMPDIDGVEVARRLRSNPKTKEIPIVFLTITIDLSKDKGYEEILVDGCKYRAMAKPMHTAKLLSIIRKTVNKRVHGN